MERAIIFIITLVSLIALFLHMYLKEAKEVPPLDDIEKQQEDIENQKAFIEKQ